MDSRGFAASPLFGAAERISGGGGHLNAACYRRTCPAFVPPITFPRRPDPPSAGRQAMSGPESACPHAGIGIKKPEKQKGQRDDRWPFYSVRWRARKFEPPTPKFVVGAWESASTGSGWFQPRLNGKTFPGQGFGARTSQPVLYRLVPARRPIGTEWARGPVKTRPPSVWHGTRQQPLLGGRDIRSKARVQCPSANSSARTSSMDLPDTSPARALPIRLPSRIFSSSQA